MENENEKEIKRMGRGRNETREHALYRFIHGNMYVHYMYLSC